MCHKIGFLHQENSKMGFKFIRCKEPFISICLGNTLYDMTTHVRITTLWLNITCPTLYHEIQEITVSLYYKRKVFDNLQICHCAACTSLHFRSNFCPQERLVFTVPAGMCVDCWQGANCFTDQKLSFCGRLCIWIRATELENRAST